MVSRAQLIIVTVIVAVGLLGPMSFIAQNAAKNQTTAASPTPPPQPVQLSQVKEYTALVTAEIVGVEPQLVVILVSGLAPQDLAGSLSNFSNASLYSLNPGQGYYTATFMLDDSLLAEQTLVAVSDSNATIVDFGMPAEISLPSSFTATRFGKDYNMSVSPADEVEAIIYGGQQSGEATFELTITESGSKKSIFAVEKRLT